MDHQTEPERRKAQFRRPKVRSEAEKQWRKGVRVGIEPHGIYEATIRLRRGPDWPVKPEWEAWDGRRVRLTTGWWIDPNDEIDGTSMYAGEWAMLPMPPLRGWPGWVASGDLTDVEPAN